MSGCAEQPPADRNWYQNYNIPKLVYHMVHFSNLNKTISTVVKSNIKSTSWIVCCLTPWFRVGLILSSLFNVVRIIVMVSVLSTLYTLIQCFLMELNLFMFCVFSVSVLSTGRIRDAGRTGTSAFLSKI